MRRVSRPSKSSRPVGVRSRMPSSAWRARLTSSVPMASGRTAYPSVSSAARTLSTRYPPLGNVAPPSVNPREGNVKMPDGLNATQGSLLGFLADGPKTGWDLLAEVEGGLARFWNVTASHVYRELRTLEERGLLTAGEPGIRDRRPFSITTAGEEAFRAWIAREPGPEQIRFPLLVTLWFGRHLESDALSHFLE